MSSTVESIQTNGSIAAGPGLSLWLRQIGAIMRLDLKKNFFSKRSLLVYLLAAMPIGLLVLVEIVNPLGRTSNQLFSIYSIFYNSMILRTVIFFGCAWIFMNLFRGEIVDRSLHYYFLSAVRREVLLAAKYLSGLVTAIILFTTVTVVSMLLLFFPHFFSASTRFFLDGAGMGQMLTYIVITVLACVGYGAFFMVVGLFFRNPIIPA